MWSAAFNGSWFWPLLGIIFLPFTTLMYAILWSVNFQWGTTIPEMSATLMPYAMSDLERIKRFPASEARKFLDAKLAQRGVQSVAWLYITRGTIITSKQRPIVALDDFKGVKIRGLNTLTDNGLRAAGAAPSAMPGSEVYQALQSGVLDAGLTDVSAAFSRKYFEVQQYGTVGPIFTIYFHMFVNPAWWQKLAPAHRQAIEAAAAQAEQDAIGVTEATAAAAIKAVPAEAAKDAKAAAPGKDAKAAGKDAKAAPAKAAAKK